MNSARQKLTAIVDWAFEEITHADTVQQHAIGLHLECEKHLNCDLSSML